jgi:acetyl-CoA/propionyl-CoA carboxylase biotin carboxyl carrier protein
MVSFLINTTKTHFDAILCFTISHMFSFLIVWIDGQTGDKLTHSQFHVPVVSYASGASVSGHPVIKSPMPGKVIKLYCAEGDSVKAGDSVVVIEAMKMEHVIVAPCDG